LTSPVALVANPPPWEDPVEAWHYLSDRVWTGEAFVFSRRTQPEPEIRAPDIPQNIEGLTGSGDSQAVEAPMFPEVSKTREVLENLLQIIDPL